MLLNSFGDHGVPGEVVDLDDAAAAPMLYFGAAHRVDEALEEVRQGIVDLVDGAAAVLAPEPLKAG